MRKMYRAAPQGRARKMYKQRIKALMNRTVIPVDAVRKLRGMLGNVKRITDSDFDTLNAR